MFCYLINLSFVLSTVFSALNSDVTVTEPVIEIYDIKRATWPDNPETFSKVENIGDEVRLSVGMGPTGDMGYGIAGLSMKVPKNLIFKATATGNDRMIDPNTYTGLIVDFHTPSGFMKRIGIPLGVHSESGNDFIPGWGRGTTSDSVIQATNRVSNKFLIDFAGNAPIGWDGVIWLNAIIENTGNNTKLEIFIQNVVIIHSVLNDCV